MGIKNRKFAYFFHLKFGRRSVSFLCDLGQVDSIITDTKAPPALLEHFSSKGIEIVLAH